MMAIFRKSDYLANPECQKAMFELSRSWNHKDQTHLARTAKSDPLTQEEIKQGNEWDLFFMQSIKGHLNRVHFVIKNKIGIINPAPGDSRCESCGKLTWLNMEYRTSKIDQANEPAWLCDACSAFKDR